jgi:hypothetical protein
MGLEDEDAVGGPGNLEAPLPKEKAKAQTVEEAESRRPRRFPTSSVDSPANGSCLSKQNGLTYYSSASSFR